ncbi:GH92 family glycosyl hydrolase [Mangrovibacterium diazotrophicum]|uniref:Putative alpha-1,2-mannosidase n=1 Tax=Mangrovibacterium diazotrophicum TaxID=1261403 RepID=A0A419VY61_9BACT|nr:GH92 family glycosyl hydrolase [Mangrovibacterium diazotrophicum]RKD88167.1 putative alpha-1,2-mannosidase [Mangrovibacterium diazotrophicum]
MKLNKLFLACLFGGIVAFSSCQTAPEVKQVDYTDYVNPFIGSGGHGHVFVGANVPFGMVQVGPQNIFKGWDWCSGYHYSDSILIGFSHTHLSGTGCSDLGDILVMPYLGDIRTERGTQENIDGSCSVYYTHDQETVSPGYYAIKMSNGINAELTATERTALHHYAFPAGEEKHILLNLKEGNDSRAFATYAKKTDEYTIEGYRFAHGWSPTRKVFFILRTNQSIDSVLVYDNDNYVGQNEIETKSADSGAKCVISLKGDVDDVLLKVAISSVSCKNAQENMDAEMKGWDFDAVHQQAVDKWNEQLAQINIKTDNASDREIFYTSMYHTCMAPQLYCDVNGEFRGHDDKIYKADWTNYSCFSLWDTYRTLNPLFTIIKPNMVDDFVNSFLSIYDQQGKLPIWPLNGGETECMPGYSAVPIIADAYLKGFTGFDADRALTDMISSATYDKQKGVSELMAMGFIPSDQVHEATSVALEYAADDWGTALMANKMGKDSEYNTFIKRGEAYKDYFDKDIQFIRPKIADGSWRADYRPFESRDFTEGTGWQYTFANPQCPELMIELMGGDDNFVSKLDSLFVAEGDMGEAAPPDISGLIGQYAHGNEPSHPFCYYYPYAGQQWKSAEKVRFVEKNFYTTKPDGVIGNEDCGQMSAWYITSALGFYQVNPSNGIFVFGSPLFERATIALPQNKTFTVEAANNSDQNIYIQSVKLNGEPYDKTYISYNEIMAGGKLEFVMGSQPNKDFGAAAESRPKSAM